MIIPKKIQLELLAPARNAEFGKAAVNHGADALYIGAPKFGARSVASNSIEDIEDLLQYAHLYKVKVYCALNTILFNSEIEEAVKIIHQLANIGIDGLILQDLGLLDFDLPPVPLIASTQTHNISSERVLFFEKLGFKRVILARELSIPKISEIRENTTIELESFVHGAICVSYSGQCYMSEAICGRSGNRGMCAQPCRSSYDLLDKNNQVVVRNKHLLSQKDLNLAAFLPSLIEAGVTSFKIEGRLKDIGYLKNITSFYRQQLDRIIEEKPAYSKSSSGKIYHSFTPDPERSFNRGFTNYYIQSRKEKTGEPNTPKSLGKRIGYVMSIGKNWISIDTPLLNNADGICFYGNDGILYGTLVNKVVENKVFVNDIQGLEVGAEVFRNHDQEFEKMLNGNCTERKIEVNIILGEYQEGYIIEAIDTDGNKAQVLHECEKQDAKNPQNVFSTIQNQMSKLGDTIFELKTLEVKLKKDYFIPISVLNEMRRRVANELTKIRSTAYIPERIAREIKDIDFKSGNLTYTENIANDNALKLYESLGAGNIEPAFELTDDHKGKVVMTTKHCIRYQLNACNIYQKNQVILDDPLYLKDNNHLYKLHFDCKKCEMQLIFEK